MTRSIEELLSAALGPESDMPEYDDPVWIAIRELHVRGGDDVLERCIPLLGDPSPLARSRAVHILAQLQGSDELRARCADAVLDIASHDPEAAVLASAGVALGHLRDPRAVAAMARFVGHTSADVRFGVVMAMTPHEHSATALEALVRLSSDVDREVRGWATFALGSQLTSDARELRDALAARLIDADVEVRGEALLGLARRKDPRVVEPLRRELEGPEVIGLAVEAAAELGDPSLLPQLEALVSGGEGPLQGILDDAIRALRAAR